MACEYYLSSPHDAASEGATLKHGPGTVSEAILDTVKDGEITGEVIPHVRVIQTLSDTAAAILRQQSHPETVLNNTSILTSDAGSSVEINGLQTSC